MKNRAAFALAAALFALVLGMCLYSAPRLATQAAAYVKAEPIVVIDAGHGGEDGGASTAEGVTESGLNLKIALRLRDILCLLGVQTRMLRETDTALSSEGCSGIAERKLSDLKNRVKLVNETENAILVSIHQNYFTQAKYRGAQVFYAATAESRTLAETIQAALRSGVDPANHRQVKASQGVYLMEHVNGPAVLVECGFLSNAAEAALLQQDEYQLKLSTAISAAIAQWMRERGTSDEV